MMTPAKAYWICKSKKKRIKKLESIILKSLNYSYLYALNVIQGRWPEAEPIILNDVCFSYYYALCVIKERWPEAEPVILKNPKCSYLYAKDIIKERWFEAEFVIQRSSENWIFYCDYFNNKIKKYNWRLGL